MHGAVSYTGALTFSALFAVHQVVVALQFKPVVRTVVLALDTPIRLLAATIRTVMLAAAWTCVQAGAASLRLWNHAIAIALAFPDTN